MTAKQRRSCAGSSRKRPIAVTSHSWLAILAKTLDLPKGTPPRWAGVGNSNAVLFSGDVHCRNELRPLRHTLIYRQSTGIFAAVRCGAEFAPVFLSINNSSLRGRESTRWLLADLACPNWFISVIVPTNWSREYASSSFGEEHGSPRRKAFIEANRC